MEPVTLVLRSKRQKRAAAVQKLQHLVPAVILLGDGWSALTRHAAGVEFAIALFELVSGALFVFAAVRGIRGAVRGASRAHPHPHAHTASTGRTSLRPPSCSPRRSNTTIAPAISSGPTC
jgi:hypothetical protein